MAVNLINSNDIEVEQTGQDIQLKTSTPISTIEGNIGDLTLLTTTDKSSLVGAINEENQLINKIGKLLWEGDFTSGNITVDGLSDYTLIAVDVAGCICFGNKNFGGGSVGAYASYSATEYTYRFNPNGDTLTIDNNNRGGSNGSTNQSVRKIWGIF